MLSACSPLVPVVLSGIGLFFGILALLSYLKVSRGFCELGRIFRCEDVYFVPDKYAKPLGIHLSVWAPLYFSLMLIVSMLNAAYGGFFTYLMLAGWLLGTFMVPYLVYVEVRVARSLCLYCTIMHIIILACLALTLYCDVCGEGWRRGHPFIYLG